MTDPTTAGSTNPDAEAAALAAAKTSKPPVLPGNAAAATQAAATARSVDVTKVQAALKSVNDALTSISQAGDVVSDLLLAKTGLMTAMKWLEVAEGKANAAAAAAPKA